MAVTIEALRRLLELSLPVLILLPPLLIVLIAAIALLSAFARERKKKKDQKKTAERRPPTSFPAPAVPKLRATAGKERRPRRGEEDYEQYAAGARGESFAFKAVHRVLARGDRHFHNVAFTYRDPKTGKERRAEIDQVVVNRFGVFAIEVKNWKGSLQGGETDEYWIKTKTTPGGEVHVKNERNPMRQVKREALLLKQSLKARGLDLWVTGLVYLVNGNSPVNSETVLSRPEEIGRAVHTLSEKSARLLSDGEIEWISAVLS